MRCARAHAASARPMRPFRRAAPCRLPRWRVRAAAWSWSSSCAPGVAFQAEDVRGLGCRRARLAHARRHDLHVPVAGKNAGFQMRRHVRASFRQQRVELVLGPILTAHDFSFDMRGRIIRGRIMRVDTTPLTRATRLHRARLSWAEKYYRVHCRPQCCGAKNLCAGGKYVGSARATHLVGNTAPTPAAPNAAYDLCRAAIEAAAKCTAPRQRLAT